MTVQEAIDDIRNNIKPVVGGISLDMAIEALEQEPCETTVINEYRNRLMDAFHNADCDELIAVVVRPEESEFKQLEWLLKNHYHKQKQQPCEDAVSRQAVKQVIIDSIADLEYDSENRKMQDIIDKLPSVTPKEKTGKWIDEEVGCDGDIAYRCSNCNELFWLEEGTPKDNEYNFCPNCGARMVKPQENNNVNCKTTKCENCTNHNYCDYEQQGKSECEHDHEVVKAYNDGQAYILDKIRAEIEQITDTMGVGYNLYTNKIDVIKIIDKYRGDTDGNS